MPSAVNLVLRDAHFQDRSAIVEVLAAAFADSDVGRWLDPDPETRVERIHTYLRATVNRALTGGTVRVADERGEVLAAALWFPYPASTEDLTAGAPTTPAPPPVPEQSPAESAVLERLRLLERRLDERHPYGPPHQHLAYLGVRPDRQNEGIGSYLLIGQHALLHVAGIPAYLEANDPRNRQLYLRHGYTDVGSPIVLPTGLPIWPMWRPPAPAGAIVSASVVSSSNAPLARLARLTGR